MEAIQTNEKPDSDVSASPIEQVENDVKRLAHAVSVDELELHAAVDNEIVAHTFTIGEQPL